MTDREREELLKEMDCQIGNLNSELSQSVSMNRDYEQQLLESEKKIAKLEGMIEAFEFCVARGNLKNDR
jgi:hypothetical protein